MATYTRSNNPWVNGQAGGTEIDADALNNFESGIANLYDLWAAKGGLVVASASSTPIALTVGANETVLVADSSQTGGVIWKQIDNDSIAAAAAIAYSKLNLTGGIVNADVNSSAAIAYSKLNLASSVTPSDMAATAWTSYTPTWGSSGTAPALGNGTISGRYQKFAKTVIASWQMTIGSTSTVGTGTYTWTLPVAASTALGSFQMLGNGWFFDSSASVFTTGVVTLNGSDLARVVYTGTNTIFGAAAPAVPASSDQYQFVAAYQAS